MKTQYKPLHPLRLDHPLEGTLRKQWEYYLSCRPKFDILCAASVPQEPDDMESDLNTLTGRYEPYPYGRMTERDHMVVSEFIQWLGSGVGFAFLSTAFERAGGKVIFDDYKADFEVLKEMQKRKTN